MPLHLPWIIWCRWIPGNPSVLQGHESAGDRSMAFEFKKSWDGIQAFHLFLESNPYLTFP